MPAFRCDKQMQLRRWLQITAYIYSSACPARPWVSDRRDNAEPRGINKQ